MSKAKNLGKALGGEWKYDGMATWWCDDGERSVSRCSAGVDEFDNELGPAQYWLYQNGEAPCRAEDFLLISPSDVLGAFVRGRYNK